MTTAQTTTTAAPVEAVESAILQAITIRLDAIEQRLCSVEQHPAQSAHWPVIRNHHGHR